MGPRHERIGPLDGSVDRPATATYPAGAVLGERVLDVHELVWVVRGAATVLAGGQEDMLRPGNVLLVPPGVVHAFRWGGGDEGAGGCVHGYVHAGLGQVAAAPRLVVAAGPASAPLGGLCAYLLWRGGRGPRGWGDQATGPAALVADLVLRGPLPGAEAVPAGPPVVGALLAELRRGWGPGPPLPAVGVAGLAAAPPVSPAHPTPTGRRPWGRPPSTPLEQLRLTPG